MLGIHSASILCTFYIRPLPSVTIRDHPRSSVALSSFTLEALAQAIYECLTDALQCLDDGHLASAWRTVGECLTDVWQAFYGRPASDLRLPHFHLWKEVIHDWQSHEWAPIANFLTCVGLIRDIVNAPLLLSSMNGINSLIQLTLARYLWQLVIIDVTIKWTYNFLKKSTTITLKTDKWTPLSTQKIHERENLLVM